MLGFFKKYFVEIIVIIFSLFFSFWLMFSTFSYNNDSILIASKAWSDFASHIPLIRSFSLGDNIPPQYPLFPGETIRYHFLFYALVGFIEKIGVRIDYALNIPSALSFTGLIIIIYFLAKTLFRSRSVGVLSVIFFLFNGSLSFIEFFKAHPLSTNTINDILTNTMFPSFGPYDGKIISAFWNLNIYTNQRHLALPLALLFFTTFLAVHSETRNKKIPWLIVIILGILVGIMPLSHSSIFIMIIVVLLVLLLFLPKQRLPLLALLLLASFISLPRILFLGQIATFTPQLKVGYLIANNLLLTTFITYWVVNFGLFFFLIPLGFLLSSPLAKKLLIAFFSLFVIGNIVQLSPEMASNHKFFNTFLIVGNIFAAYSIIRIWQWHTIGKIIIPFLLFFAILSGIIDFFPIKNDRFLELADYPKNPDVRWIMDNTPKDAVFLNSSYLYHPVNLAGRKIFLGWPYYPWSLGYNTVKRGELLKKLYNPQSLAWECQTLKENKIDYIALDEKPDPTIFVHQVFFIENFEVVHQNNETGFTIFNPLKKCKEI